MAAMEEWNEANLRLVIVGDTGWVCGEHGRPAGKKGTQASDADQIERGYENYDLNRFYLWLE
jgi:hypothetical protein